MKMDKNFNLGTERYVCKECSLPCELTVIGFHEKPKRCPLGLKKGVLIWFEVDQAKWKKEP